MLEHNTNAGALRQGGGSFAERRAADLTRRSVDTSDAVKDPNLLAVAATVRVASSEAVDFLRHFDPRGVHNLVALDPHGIAHPEGRTFQAGEWAAMADWIDRRDGRLNLYFSVNEPAPKAPNKKLSKSDISAIRALCIDLDIAKPASGADPEKHFKSERVRLRQQVERLKEHSACPTIILDSGGGIQAFWVLSKKLDATAEQYKSEAQGRGLINHFGGDSVENIDRVMRLPGTVNIPTADKIAKGQQKRRATVLSIRATPANFEDLGRHFAPLGKDSALENNPEIEQLIRSIDLHFVSQTAAYNDLPPNLVSKFSDACGKNDKLSDLWKTGLSTGRDKSASAARFDLAKFLKSAGFTPDEFGALLWVWKHATSPGKTRLEELEDYELQREIARCWINSPEAPRQPDPNDYFDVIDDNPFMHQETAANTTKLFSLVSFADAARSALAQSAKPLIKGFLDEGALSVLYGESNTGKSFLAMDIAYHIATGQKWANCRTTQSGVVYVAAEGGQGVLRRVLALQRHFATIAADSVPFHFLVSGVNLRSADADLKPLVETVRGCGGVGLVVLDTLSRVLAGGDENSSVDMGAFVRNVDHLRHATGAHTMLVHHSGKNRAKGARGHSLLRAATDTEIEIADNEITVTKQRDIDGNFRRSFVLDPLELGKDADGDPITSCVVRLVSNVDRPVAEPAEAEKEVLAVLGELHAADVSASHFHEDTILDTLVKSGTALTKAALRSRLRTMESKRLVNKPAKASYSLRRDKLSAEKSADHWFDVVDIEE